MIWLLDVDGVINAVTPVPPTTFHKSTWVQSEAEAMGTKWPIMWSTEVRDFMRDMLDEYDVEIRWHTTWQESAINIQNMLELEDYDMAIAEAPEYHEFNKSVGWWKMGAAIRVVKDECEPLIWTDDDLWPGEAAYFKEETREDEVQYCFSHSKYQNRTGTT